jgi:uncharacterized protein (DUF1810 family)
MMPSVTDSYNLQRFIDAQADDFATALKEIRAGSKESHWMWFIFPQLAGLGTSPTSQFYAIVSLDEARAYLSHSLLGPRLRHCLGALGLWAGRRTAQQIFGSVDARKLRSCLTLFDQVEQRGIFARALAAFFDDNRDERTLALLNGAH